MHTAILKAPRAALAEYDQMLTWVVLALLCIGLVMVYSASIATAEDSKFTGFHPTYYLVRHGIFIFVGLAAGVAAFQVKVETWQKLAPWLFMAGVLLLVLVLIPGVGKSVNGSRRWLSLFVINLQPSELMKLFAVLYAADYTVRKGVVKHTFVKAFLPMFSVMGLVGALLLLEPDMGAFVVICSIAICTLWLGGFNLKVFGMLMFALPLAFVVLIGSSPYRMQRIKGFWDPWSDPFGKGYQLSHALIAFGRGEWFGVGLGASVEKLFYLPEAHTDFLLAVIAEELGFVGVCVVILLFAGVLVRAFAIGRQAAFLDRQFAALLAQGTAVWLAVQAMINIGVNMGVLPTKGLTLPFLSFGGSGVVVNCIAVAILLRIDWENRRMMRGQTI
ncbi:MAG: putative lipid II flippase FtsW [Nitrosomonadales bacterium]|nr:putative lipid II flippase FtsW [Nitrosomonadales bacterium]